MTRTKPRIRQGIIIGKAELSESYKRRELVSTLICMSEYIGYVDIFINPPSMEALRERLEGRGTDSADVIERRLENAEGEMARAGEYMYQITNDDLSHAFKRLCDLIDALSGRM